MDAWMHTFGATNNMPNTSHMVVITLCMTSLVLHCYYCGTSAQRIQSEAKNPEITSRFKLTLRRSLVRHLL